MKFGWIQHHQGGFAVQAMCDILGVSRSGYYAWKRRAKSNAAKRRARLLEHIQKAHRDSRQNYGSPRITHELQAQGIKCCQNTVARIMHENNVKSKMKRKFRVQTTDSEHGMPIAKNVLGQQFKQTEPNRVWASDITYVPTREGWLYLAVVLDLYSRRVIGWAMADHLKSSLAIDALGMAIDQRRAAGQKLNHLLHHSDRGAQYASDVYRTILAAHDIEASMSRRGNCYDNAVVESFFGSLKTELIHHEDYKTRQQATQSIFDYIEVFYNRQRRHSTLGYKSPAEFEAA